MASAQYSTTPHRRRRKGIWIWLSNVSCLGQILGLISSTYLMVSLTLRGSATCRESFFTTFNETVGCKVTEIGKIIIYVHYSFVCLSALSIVFFYLIAWFQLRDYHLTFIILFSWFLIPVFIPITIVMMIVYTIKPKILFKRGSTAMLFYAIWLGFDSHEMIFGNGGRFSFTLRQLQIIASVLQVLTLLFENVVEVIITIILFTNGYISTISIVFFVPVAFNVTMKLIVFISQLLYDCLTILPICCRPMSGRTSVNASINTVSQRVPV